MTEENRLHKYGRWFFTLALTAAGIWLGIRVIPRLILYFIPFVIGWLVALMAAPLVRFAKKKLNITSKIVSGFVIVIILAALFGMLYGIIDLIIGEILDFIPDIPKYLGIITEALETVGGWLNRLTEGLPESVILAAGSVSERLENTLADAAAGMGSAFTGFIGSFLSALPNALVYFVFSILCSFFLISEKDGIKAWVVSRMPEPFLDKLRYARSSLKKAFGGYLACQFKMMWIVALLILIGLLILGKKYAIVISLITAFIDALPVFGSGFVLWPWALIDLLGGHYWSALGLMLIYAVVQLTRQFLQPRIMGDSIGMSPLATLFFFYVGFKISGIGGMIIAAPIGMFCVELIRLGVLSPAHRVLAEMAAAVIALCTLPTAEASGETDSSPETADAVPEKKPLQPKPLLITRLIRRLKKKQ